MQALRCGGRTYVGARTGISLVEQDGSHVQTEHPGSNELPPRWRFDAGTTAPRPAVVPRPGDGSLRQTFLRLRMVGLTDTEAADLTAHLSGLRISGRPWTLAQVEHLAFLRSLLDSGRLVP